MALLGKELEEELGKRKMSREDRLNRKLTLRNYARLKGASCEEISDYENGRDICPHEEWEDQVGGFPLPKFVYTRCKKCGKVKENSMEKVTDENLERAYEVVQRNSN